MNRTEWVARWLKELAQEAFTQGFLSGQQYGADGVRNYGRRFIQMRDTAIQKNEYPNAPICGNEMDGIPTDLLAILDGDVESSDRERLVSFLRRIIEIAQAPLSGTCDDLPGPSDCE